MQPNNMVNEKIHVLVRNRKKIFFDADVKAVTSINDKGKFDILPEHAHFISLIQKYILIHTLDGKEQNIDIGYGVLKVSDNQVNCYVDLITPPKEAPVSTADNTSKKSPTPPSPPIPSVAQ